MSLFSKIILFVCLLTLPSAQSFGFRPKTTVKVINSLGNMNLSVHCKSKDDDLGLHYLPPGANYQWTFVPSFWGHTQFYCYFQWPGTNWKSFDVYIEKRYDDYSLVIWSIKQGGPCFLLDPSTSGSSFDKWKCYPWNQGN